MNMRTVNEHVYGSGGGKGGGRGGGITEAADTVSSTAKASFVDLIGEGRIKGLVNGERSIYLDGIPLRSLLGTANYLPFQWEFTPGTQDQSPIPGFAGTQSETTVGVPLLFSSGKIIRPITDADADAVRVTVSVNGLSQTSTDGKVGVASVSYRISVSQVGGSWVTAYEGTMTEKTSSRFQRSHEVPVADLGAGPYQVAVERVSPDSTSALLVNGINWDSFTTINFEQFAYPNSALIGIGIDARYFSQVPTRGYHVEGLLVRIPSNYNPRTRQYTGVWNGTFITDYTNNPAWCLFDILTHPRYGCGSRITDATANKWAFYAIAKYCDEPVPTGADVSDIYRSTTTSSFSADGRATAGIPQWSGPTEPRFTLNVVINEREDAYKVLNNLASVFRGMVYWASGQVFLTQDSPAEPAISWTNANVIGGEFVSEGSSRSQRHTVAMIGWNDPSEDFKQKFEYVEDREGIARYGVRPTEIVAFGCTSRSQARRAGLWLLYTEKLEKDAISFKVGLDSAQVRPGMIGEITDNKRLGARWGGRLISATTTAVVLDAPITLVAGTYTLTTTTAAGGLVKKSVIISGPTTTDSLTVTVPFDTPPGVMTIWGLASTTVVPRLVRVVGIKQDGPATFSITALTHNPSKFGAIERGEKLDKPDYSFLSYDGVPAITNLVASENSYKIPTLGTTSTSLDASWDQITDPLVRGYRIKLTAAAGGIQNLPEQSRSSFSLQGVPPDTVTVHVSAINLFGIPGPESTYTVTIVGIDTTKPVDVSGLTATVSSGILKVKWNSINDLSYAGTELHIEPVWNSSTAPLFKGGADSYNWPSPTVGSYTLLAKHFDSSGNYSQNATSLAVEVTHEQLDYDATLLVSTPQLVVNVDSAKVVTPAGSATFSVKVWSAGVDVSSNWTIGVYPPQGVTLTNVGNDYSVVSMVPALAAVSFVAVPRQGTQRSLTASISLTRAAGELAGPALSRYWNSFNYGVDETVTSGVKLKPDGTVEVIDWRSYSSAGNWYLPTTTSIGGSYWIKTIRVRGVGPNTGDSLGVWLPLTSERKWESSANPGTFYTDEFSYQISSDAAGATIVGSGSIVLDMRSVYGS